MMGKIYLFKSRMYITSQTTKQKKKWKTTGWFLYTIKLSIATETNL